MDNYRILIADFEPDSAEYFSRVLEAHGCEIIIAASSIEAWNKALIKRPQMALIDMMNSEMAGIDLSKKFRNSALFKDMLIYLYTYHYEDYLLIDGINSLVNRLLPKPFNIEFLLDQIKKEKHSLSHRNRDVKCIESGGLVIDIEGYSVKLVDRYIELTKREFELLLFLAGEPRRYFTREEITRYLWENKQLQNNRILDVYIAKLRKKLGHIHILTRKGVGYAFA